MMALLKRFGFIVGDNLMEEDRREYDRVMAEGVRLGVRKAHRYL